MPWRNPRGKHGEREAGRGGWRPRSSRMAGPRCHNVAGNASIPLARSRVLAVAVRPCQICRSNPNSGLGRPRGWPLDFAQRFGRQRMVNVTLRLDWSASPLTVGKTSFTEHQRLRQNYPFATLSLCGFQRGKGLQGRMRSGVGGCSWRALSHIHSRGLTFENAEKPASPSDCAVAC